MRFLRSPIEELIEIVVFGIVSVFRIVVIAGSYCISAICVSLRLCGECPSLGHRAADQLLFLLQTYDTETYTSKLNSIRNRIELNTVHPYRDQLRICSSISSI